MCFLIQYVLPLSLPDDFDNNIKQIIYVLGKRDNSDLSSTQEDGLQPSLKHARHV